MSVDITRLAEQARAGINCTWFPENQSRYDEAMAAVDALVAEIERLQQERRPVPTNEGGPSKEDTYWLRAKLGGAVTHLRDIEDYYRTLGGLPEGFNRARADRARSLYEQISDDFINGKMDRPTMQERAERAEAERDALREALEAARPYVYNTLCAARVNVQPWRVETAETILASVDEALAAGVPAGEQT